MHYGVDPGAKTAAAGDGGADFGHGLRGHHAAPAARALAGRQTARPDGQATGADLAQLPRGVGWRQRAEQPRLLAAALRELAGAGQRARSCGDAEAVAASSRRARAASQSQGHRVLPVAAGGRPPGG